MSAGKTIRAGIKLDGEKEFRAAVKGINGELDQLKASGKLVAETYKGQANGLQALKAKHDVLKQTLQQNIEKQKAYGQALAKAKSDYSRIGMELDKLKQKRDQEVKKLDEMRKAGTASEQEMKKQEQTVKELNSAIALGEKNYERAGQRIQKYSKEHTNAQTETAKTTNALKDNEKYMKEAEKATDSCATSIDEFGKKSKNASDAIKSSGEAIGIVAKNLAADKVKDYAKQITQALIECEEAASTFSKGIAKVMTIADTSKITTSEMSRQIMELSAATGRSVNDISEATYQAISASVDTADAVSFVGTATKLAAGGFTDQATAVDTLTTVINAYGMKSEDATHVADLLVETQNKGKTTVAELAQTYGQVIPAAASANVSFENLSTAMALTTKNGMQTAIASTSLRAMLTELAKGGSNVSKVLKKETGKSFSELMDSGKSLGDVMDILLDSVNGDMDAFKQLFGNVRSGNAAYFLAKEGAEAFNTELERMVTTSGQASEAAATMADTSAAAEMKFQNAIENTKIAIGEVLEPALAELKLAGADAFNWATEFIKEHPGLVSAITGVVIALGLGATAIAGLGVATTVVIPALKAMYTEMMALSTVPILLPLTAIAAAITGITAAVTIYNKKMETVEGTHQHAIKSLKDARNAIEDTREAFASETEEVENSYGSYSALIDRLEELNGIEEKTTAQKAEMTGIVAQLSDVIPGLAEAFDEEAGKITMAKDEMEKYIQVSKDAAMAEALIKQQKELGEEMVATEKALEEANAKLEEYKENANAASMSGWDTQSAKVSELRNEISKLEETSSGLEEEFNSNNEAIGRLTQSANEGKNSLSGVSEEAQMNAQALDDMAESAEEAAQALEESIAGAAESVTSSFDKINKGAEYTADEIIENLQYNEQAFQQWSDDLVAIGDRTGEGMTKEIYDKLVEMGPESANLIHSVAQMDEAQFAEFIRIFGEGGGDSADAYADAVLAKSDELANVGMEVPEAVASGVTANGQTTADAVQDLINRSYLSADVVAGVTTGNDMSGAIEDGIYAKKDPVANAVKLVSQQAAAASDQKAFEKSGNMGTERMASGFRAKKSSTEAAVRAVSASAASAGRSYYSSFSATGSYIISGMRAGIKSAASSVASAARSVVSSALSAAKKALNINSPSRVFRDQVGVPISEGIAAGIIKAKSRATSATSNVVSGSLSTGINALKTYYNLSARQTMQYWANVRLLSGLTRKEQMEADQAYYDAVLAYNEEILAVQNNLKSSVAELETAYKDSVKNTTQNIMSAYDTLSVFYSESVSGDELLHNLETQVWGYGEWQKEVDAITEKFKKNNLNSILLDELIEKGPQYAATLRALNQLDTSDLQRYSDLYTEKLAMSEAEAIRQQEELKKSTKIQIQELNWKAQEELKAINTALSNEMMVIAKSASKWGEDTIIAYVQGMTTTIQRKELWANLQEPIRNAVGSDAQNAKKAVSSTSASSSAKSTSVAYYKKYTGSSGSIVDALKAIGTDSSYAHRSRIAAANGISGYNGTAEQNTRLLRLLKAGQLKIANKKGGIIDTLIPFDLINGDDGIVTAQYGEMILPKQFSQDVVPRFTRSVENLQKLIDASMPSTGALNRLISRPVPQISAVPGGENKLTEMCAQMLALFQQYIPRMANQQIVTDTGAVIAEFAEPISQEIAAMNRRIQ